MTRSNSAIPLAERIPAAPETSVSRTGFDAGKASTATRYFGSAAATSSTSDPHFPQSGHRPSHFGELNPQEVQA
jgi:hypothetical protein